LLLIILGCSMAVGQQTQSHSDLSATTDDCTDINSGTYACCYPGSTSNCKCCNKGDACCYDSDTKTVWCAKNSCRGSAAIHDLWLMDRLAGDGNVDLRERLEQRSTGKQTANQKNPACVKQCGEDLRDALSACENRGRKCLSNSCNMEEKLANCVASCVMSGTRAPICFANCSIEAGRSCAEQCTDQMTSCREEALKQNKDCTTGCS